MAPARYSFEKGKYGIFPGTIVAFPRSLTGSLPNDPEFKDAVPAGYLRCNGEVLRVDDYPELAGILGVGDDCRFKKEQTELDEDEFQLPDLGSKTITAGTAQGQYQFLNAPRNGEDFPKAGIGVELRLNQSGEYEVRYDGSLGVPQYDFQLSNQRVMTSTLQPRLEAASVSIGGYLSHGHYGNFPQSFRINPPSVSDEVPNYDNEAGQPECSNDEGIQCASEDASPNIGDTQQARSGPATVGTNSTFEDTEHSHQFEIERVERSSTELSVPTEAEAFNLVTTINVRADNTFKLDNIGAKFVLVEYFIKF